MKDSKKAVKLAMELVNKSETVVDLALLFQDIFNESNPKVAMKYKEGLSDLAHILLYTHIHEDVMFRMGGLGKIVSDLKILDPENYEKVHAGFMKVFNIYVTDYGR